MTRTVIPFLASGFKEQIKNVGTETKAETSIESIVKVALMAVFGITAVIAIVMVVLGGINYTTSQGDPQKVTKAKNTITYGVIGLVVSISAFAIVYFVLGKISN